MRVGTSPLVLFQRFFSQLLQAQKGQVSFIKCRNSPHLLKLAHLLSQKNYILAYRSDKHFLYLALRLTGQATPIGIQPPFRQIRVYSSTSRFFFVTQKKLLALTTQNPFTLYILSTPQGLLSADQALAKQTGGLLIAGLGY